jgi:undecaprenyl phosphate-alpha-L-ara4FN deformylase
MGRDRVLGLKVDVDTRRGMEEGVPALLSLLAGFGLRATFFLSFGPDNSGKALYRMIRNPRFLFKMFRTNAPGLYGFRTALYGTLLKAPMIASALPALCREIEERGHEVEFHAWDHRAWQDSLPGKGREWIKAWLDDGISAYESCLGHSPRAFGAPGWMLTGTAVEEIARRKWEYLSCTRAPAPFLLGGTGLAEIPSDLPCMEEVGGRKGVGVVVDVLSGGGTHVYPSTPKWRGESCRTPSSQSSGEHWNRGIASFRCRILCGNSILRSSPNGPSGPLSCAAGPFPARPEISSG